VALPEIPGYRILRPLGTGGMSTVYLAVQLSLDRQVAVKVLRSAPEDDPERTEKRFLREGRTLARISHKNVCGIYDIAKVADIAYIAMEYLDGGTLVDRLRRGISVGESIAVVVQLASALDEAHKLGIIHRDLKPANVMLRGGKVPVLTDFGIAREMTAAQTRITAENMIVGTPIYMSPEQVSGGEVDGRSDLYALGVMFFELLTGQPPFRGDTAIAVCMQHLTAPIPPLPADLADLQPVLERMLAKKREDRYASMGEFTRALRSVFVSSDALRNVLAFAPDTPWSEQLRELGFSFDTLRDAELRAALAAKQARRGSEERTEPAPAFTPSRARPKAATTPAVRRARPWPWPWIAAGALSLALLLSAGWWFTRPQPEPQASASPAALDETTLLALKALQDEFQRAVNAGELYAPRGRSALHHARRMEEIAPGHAYGAKAMSDLAQAGYARARAAREAGDISGTARALDDAARFLPENFQAEIARLRAELLQAPASAPASTAAPASAPLAAPAPAQGRLAIDAAPWGQIESVVDGSGRALALPAGASTPLVLELPAGSYRVRWRPGGDGAPREQSVVVASGGLAVLSLRGNPLTADDYLREAGL
jgi:serine/threonine protein kinase